MQLLNSQGTNEAAVYTHSCPDKQQYLTMQILHRASKLQQPCPAASPGHHRPAPVGWHGTARHRRPCRDAPWWPGCGRHAGSAWRADSSSFTFIPIVCMVLSHARSCARCRAALGSRRDSGCRRRKAGGGGAAPGPLPPLRTTANHPSHLNVGGGAPHAQRGVQVGCVRHGWAWHSRLLGFLVH